MDEPSTRFDETGLEVVGLDGNAAFEARSLHRRDSFLQMQAIQRLSRAFVDAPHSILQELTNAAVELCGADSAGISLEIDSGSDAAFYEWIATAGIYTPMLGATLPRYPSACGICLERGRPQLLRVSQRFFDIMGVEAPLVTDGILLPWHTDARRGTLWILAHGRTEAFDREDCRMMEMLADFAALAIRKQKQQEIAVQRAASDAAALVATDLARKINDSLQSIVDQIYIAAISEDSSDAKQLAESLVEPVAVLSEIVRRQLAVGSRTIN